MTRTATRLLESNLKQRLHKLAQHSPQVLLFMPQASGIDTQAIAEYYAECLLDSEHSTILELNGADMGISEIRQIQHVIRSRSVESDEKYIIVLHSFDALSQESQNALLKVLEEPNQQVYFVLDCLVAGNVLPTVQSRSHKVVVPRLTAEDIVASGITDNMQLANQALMATNGDAAAITDYIEGNSSSVDKAKSCLQASKFERMKQIDAYTKSRTQTLELLSQLARIHLYLVRSSIQKGQTSQTERLLENIHMIDGTTRYIHANGNIKLGLVNLFSRL